MAYRVCTECGKPMYHGYCIHDGLEYYCSDQCMDKHYTEEQYSELYAEDEGYYTEWEEEEEAF